MSRLTASLQVGGRNAPSRLLFGPHVTNLGKGRAMSSRHTAYYARRARGGAGIIVTETASVHPSDFPYERAPLAEACGAGWGQVAAAVGEAGALVIAALGHSGAQGSSAWSQAPLWAPSPMAQNNDREVPKEMERGDIAEVVSGFGSAAAWARAADMDGVEVNAGQSSLVRQFLSGLTNQRSDEYGQDRSLLLREVLQACRVALDGGILGLRLSCDEMAPWAGVTPESAAKIVDGLADQVDYLVVERGSIYSTWATRPDGHVAPGFNLDLVRQIHEVVGDRTVLIAQGSIVDVAMAEAVLGEGICAAVEMTRAQIADAELGNKVRAGDVDRARPCILCNQQCSVRDARNPIVSCTVDPLSGWEGVEDVKPRQATPSRATHVLVVGGGPAGLEAARLAASRGHRVTVREQGPTLGGAASTAATLPGLERINDYLAWLERECRIEGVTIETGVTVDAADLEAHVGHVLLCTGSMTSPSHVPHGPLPVVDGRSALDAIASRGTLPDGPVVIWDHLGAPLGLGLAELLAPGRVVTLVTPDLIVGRDLALTGDLAPGNTRLQVAGVRIIKTAEVVSNEDDGVVVEDRYTGVRQMIEAALIIDARHREPETTLWAQTGKRFARVGDALAPRTIHEAVLEARRAAIALDRSA